MYREFTIYIRKNSVLMAKARVEIEYKKYCRIKILEGVGTDVEMKCNEKSWCWWLLKNYGEGLFNVQIINLPSLRKNPKTKKKSRGARRLWKGTIYKDGFMRWKEEPEYLGDDFFISIAPKSIFSLMFHSSKPVGEYHSLP